MTVSDIKEFIREAFDTKCSFSYVSNLNLLDAHTWAFVTLNTAKAYSYNDREIRIVAKFSDFEEYETLINKAFYAIIDNKFTDRIDNFNNRTLEYTMSFKVKSQEINMAPTIHQIKSLGYLVETTFGQAYDRAATFQEMAIAEIEIDRAPEDLTTLYMNKTRVLDEDHASGRTTGSATFKNNLSVSTLANHKDLIGVAAGTVVTPSKSEVVSAVAVASNKVSFTVADSSTFTAGDLIQFRSDAGVYYAINRAVIVDPTTVQGEFEVCNDEITRITGKTGHIFAVTYIRPSVPDLSKTFQFVVVFQDDTVEVFRGASAKASFTITKEGQAELNWEIKAAEVQSIDMDTKTALEAPTTDFTAEAVANPIIFNFQSSMLYDYKNDTPATNFPFSLDLEFGNELQPITKTGCLNNIGGWYTKPSIKGTANWERNEYDLVNFSKAFEGDSNGFFFTSSSTFAFFAPYAKFTNPNAKNVDSYDSLETMINVNSWVSSEPLLVFPQTFTPAQETMLDLGGLLLHLSLIYSGATKEQTCTENQK